MIQGRFFTAAGTAAAAAVVGAIALPAFSSAATVKSDLKSFTAAPAAAQPRAVSPNPQVEPPLHGTNPHGQGTVATVDLNPSANRPFSEDTTGRTDSEDVVIGRARGEQRADGSYRGHITVAALFGNEIIAGTSTGAGQSVDTGIAQSLLDGLCTSTGICLNGVRMTSSTTTTGSTNKFNLLSAALGGAVPGAPIPAGVPALRIGAGESNGNIGTDAECQTTRGDSAVANVTATTVVAGLSTSSSVTRACRGRAPEQTNDSRVLQLGQTGIAIPPILTTGCDTGAPDSVGGIPAVLPIICNADDSSVARGAQPAGTQTGGTATSDPYGVRDALDVYVLATGPTAATRISTSASESLSRAPLAAVAPPPGTTPPATTPPATTPPADTPPATTPPATTPPATTPPATNPPATDTGDGGDTGGGGDDDGGEGPADNNAGGGGDTECSDRVDNDGDGKVDFGNDPGCSSASDDSELNGGARLSGARAKQLPFTGTDAAGLGLAGAILLAAGLTLRGPSRRRELGS